MTEPGQQFAEAFNPLAVQLYALLRPREQRVVLTVATVDMIADVWIQVFGDEGDQQSAEGRYRSVPPTTELVLAVARLRQAMYVPDRGAWYTAQVLVNADRSTGLKTWLDHEPRLAGVDPAAWGRDAARFPRTPEHTPAWLAERLAPAPPEIPATPVVPADSVAAAVAFERAAAAQDAREAAQESTDAASSRPSEAERPSPTTSEPEAAVELEAAATEREPEAAVDPEADATEREPEPEAAVAAEPASELEGEPDFVAIIRDAVASDPDNLALRIDLIELLLQDDPEQAVIEVRTLAQYGANPQTVQVLRARAAAAFLRKRLAPDAAAGADDPAPAALRASEVPTAPAPDSAPAAPAAVAAPASAAAVASGEAAPGHESADAPQRIPAARAGGSDDGVPVWDVERPGVTLADVAGLEEVKRHLESSFLAPMRNPDLARMFGKAPRGSLLMYGPPGCGKTFIARAVAGELGAGFLHVTLADIMGQYFGESEKAIQALFKAARSARPCVIFIDEFDAIGGRRTTSSSPASQALRMVTSQLLEEFDGVDASNEGIYVLAATNRPWDIDPALRRPGRLDRTVLILPPDEPARGAILRHALRDKPAAAIDTTDIVARTREFSGADLSYIVETAVESAFMDSLQAGVPRMITTYDLEAAASRVVPSTRSWFEQIKPVLEYGVDDGTFAQLRSYLKQHRI
ncbi:ATP-binding protein [Microbacterium hibisci]|uniref:ATP-binding protein n=1 Tax=Microbacterium hibisci TaxID=2036000 RepID=UPI001EF3B435|nr:ATP-binding protein [Microbacterium hibisci]